MRIKIEFFATLRERFGKRIELELEGSEASLSEALSRVSGLLEEVSESGELKPMYKVLVNGINVEFLKGLETIVRDGDEISIFPPAGGG